MGLSKKTFLYSIMLAVLMVSLVVVKLPGQTAIFIPEDPPLYGKW